MSTRALLALAVAVAVSVSAVTTVLQTTLRTSASAASGTSGAPTAQQLNHDIQMTLDVKEQILVQLKASRKKTEASLASLKTSAGNAGNHTVNIDKDAADTLVPLSSMAADGKLLTESAPPGYDLTPGLNGLSERVLAVAHALCVDAEQTQWGHVSRERGFQANCDG
jgi:hypothetical protein